MANYSNKDVMFVVARNIFFILLIAVAYQYLFQMLELQLREKISLRDKYQAISDDLDNFIKTNEGMYETKVRIEDSIASISAEYVPNQALSTSFRDRVFAVADEYSVKITSETLIRSENSNDVVLSAGFNAKYSTIYKFFFALEMFSKISSFSINEKYDAVFECSPLLYGQRVDDFFSGRIEARDDVSSSGYFKEIFSNAKEAVDTLGHIPSWRDVDPAPANPFYEYVPPKVVKKAKVVVKRRPPEIIISGIIYDEINPIVIIDSKLYRQGDYYKTVKIVSIKERTITVELDGDKYIIKFNKEE
jgi:hypothetical protein